MYTLASLLGKQSKWLKTRNLVPNEQNDKWVTFNARKLDLMLIKVGMTTKTVAKRILQWEQKCNHKLVCLYPDSEHEKKLSLLEKFKLLSLKSKQTPCTYSAFQETQKGFFVGQQLPAAEREIHSVLKLKFGRGEVHCTGCVEKRAEEAKRGIFKILSKKDPFEDYNVHVEWFPIPKKMLRDVYKIIDTICMKYTP